MLTPYKYYSPVTDVTFRKVFGEHIDLAASLLNAFLPLEDGRVITNIQYVPPEMMPETPTPGCPRTHFHNSLASFCPDFKLYNAVWRRLFL